MDAESQIIQAGIEAGNWKLWRDANMETKGLLNRGEKGEHGIAIFPERGGFNICVLSDVRDYDQKANARRLCACWNALEGISTEALENGIVVEAIGALRITVDYFEDRDWVGGMPLDQARAALSKLKGAVK